MNCSDGHTIPSPPYSLASGGRSKSYQSPLIDGTSHPPPSSGVKAGNSPLRLAHQHSSKCARAHAAAPTGSGITPSQCDTGLLLGEPQHQAHVRGPGGGPGGRHAGDARAGVQQRGPALGRFNKPPRVGGAVWRTTSGFSHVSSGGGLGARRKWLNEMETMVAVG